MAQYFAGGAASAPLDPAKINDMSLWLDERWLAPDGAAATTIELNALAVKAYSEMLSVAKYTPEQGRYFGQYKFASRPLLSTYNGWRAPHFKHDNSGGGLGTYLTSINSNATTTTVIGTVASYLYPRIPAYTAFCCKRIPTVLVNGEEYWSMASQGVTWLIKILPDTSGPGHLYAYIVQQGESGTTVSPFVDLFVGGFAAAGDLLCFMPFFANNTLQMEVMRTDGTVVSTFASAVDPLGPAQVNAYKFVIGGKDGLGSWDGPILACGICQRLMPQAERRALGQSLLTKYSTPTGQTWPEGPTPIDPYTVYPAQHWGPGAFTVAGGVVSAVANGGGNGAAGFAAAGAARPTKALIGTLDALTGDGVNQFMQLAAGTEADINADASAFTILGAVVATAQTPTFPSTPTVISGDSGIADPLYYIAGGIRGPMLLYPGVVPAGIVQTTTIGWVPPTQLQVYVGQNIPSEDFDGFYTARAICNGEQQSTYGNVQTGSRAGTMYLLQHVGNRFVGTATPPHFWSREISYRIIQGMRRTLSLAAGLALP